MRVQARPSVPAIAGSAVHVGTEQTDKLLLSGQTDSSVLIGESLTHAYASYIEATDKEAKAGWEPSSWKSFGRQDWQWYNDTGIPNSIAAYINWRLENPWPLADVPNFGPAVEVPFNYYVTPGRLVHGWIDRIFVVEGQLVPLDIKSGLKPKTSEQLGLYAAAVKDGLGWDLTTGYYLYGLKSGTASLTKPADLRLWTPERLGRLYETASLIIEHKLFVPNPGDACFVCSVSHHCEFALAAI